MFKIFCKLFVKDYQDVENSKVRERYGMATSIFSIICNIFMVIFKLIISYITNSVSIRADAYNNLSDVGSNLASLFGFKLSNKHPDREHPYGHGRMEYISGMIVAFLILLVGFEALKEAIFKIINPITIKYSNIAILILIVSILTKLLMSYINKQAAKTIDSPTLDAASQDSINDAIMTSATLFSLIVFKIFDINADAYVGLIASIFVLKSGLGIFKEVMDTILGKVPSKELIDEIEKDVCAHEGVLGVHDLMMHDYGPSHRFVVLHAEVDASIPVMEIHDTIDNIENEILEKYKILATIHMDPIDTKDELVKELKVKIKDIVLKINDQYNIHDLRVVRGTTHTNIVFDVLIPADDKINHEELKKTIDKEVKKLDSKYNTVIQIDHAFV